MKSLAVILALTQLFCSCVSYYPVSDVRDFPDYDVRELDRIKIIMIDGRKIRMEYTYWTGNSIWGYVSQREKKVLTKIEISEIRSIQVEKEHAGKTVGFVLLLVGIPLAASLVWVLVSIANENN